MNHQDPPADAPTGPADPPGQSPSPNAAGPELTQLLTQVSVFRARGRLDEALATCQQAVERDPQSWEAHELLGDLYRQKGKGEEAMREYRTALARNPGRGVIEEKIARASLIAADRRRLLEQADALLAGKADRSEARSPSLAALFSFIIPGLGQVYNREHLKGLVLIIVWVILVAALNLTVLPALRNVGAGGDLGSALAAFFSGRALVVSAVLAVLWIYAVGDAAFRASKTMVAPEDLV